MNDRQMSSDSEMAMVPTETTLEARRSPVKTRRMGVTAAQKQALIENLQLEITERARKLRSNYNIHAQSLRTRIEIRVNRIPMSLRKMKMGDLLNRYSNQQHQQRPPVAGYLKGPPVPEKDPNPSKVYPPRAGGVTYPAASAAGAPKRRSHEMTGGDKENETDTIANPKKRPRAEQPSSQAPPNPLSRSQNNNVLSPTSSNTRTVPRNNNTTTPGNTIRSGIARPTAGGAAVSPTKGTTTTSHSLNNTINRPPPSISRPGTSASARKMNFSSSTSTSASSSAVKRKRAATAAAPAPAPAKSGTARTGQQQQRRISGTSESSEGSTSTVIRKRPATAPGERPPITKAMGGNGHAKSKSGMVAAGEGTGKKAATVGTAAGKKVVAAAGKMGTTGSAGRVLRKRA
ncbi:Borealin N terminal-domain-containing protein [Triangularia setosa]|uniref:Borealin N terminal-domain-containing protein n=1 Tax=Triangularia setosa TaxID=2587417 RepID=A0AAN6WAZ1_9PEZI|nr:Borealin N terminal-domain-containing protein [Podospora setosa]